MTKPREHFPGKPIAGAGGHPWMQRPLLPYEWLTKSEFSETARGHVKGEAERAGMFVINCVSMKCRRNSGEGGPSCDFYPSAEGTALFSKMSS